MIPYRNLEFLSASLYESTGQACFIRHISPNVQQAYQIKFWPAGVNLWRFLPAEHSAQRFSEKCDMLLARAAPKELLKFLPEGWTWPEFLVAMAMFEQGKERGQNS